MPTRMVTLNKRKKKIKKGKVIPYSNEDVDYYLYNNLPMPYYDDWKLENDWKIERLLIKNEVAELVPEIYSGYHYITNFGRVLNAKMVRWISILDVDGRYLLYHLDGKRWYLKTAMEKYGWKYNYKKITKLYKKLDYPCRKVKYSYKSQRIETLK